MVYHLIPWGLGGSNPSRTKCFPLLVVVTRGNSPRKTQDPYWYQTRALDWPTTRRFVQQKAPVKSSSLPQHPLNHHSPITLPDKTRVATGSPGESHKCWSVWERDLRFIELRFELMTPIVKRYIYWLGGVVISNPINFIRKKKSRHLKRLDDTCVTEWTLSGSVKIWELFSMLCDYL